MDLKLFRLLLVALACLPAAACDGQDSSTPDESLPGDTVTLVGGIEWSMPARFGLDANDNGLIDIPNTMEYVLNLDPGACGSGCADVTPEFSVVLDASSIGLLDAAGRDLAIDSYEWKLTSASGSSAAVASESALVVVEVPEGIYEVTLEVIAGRHRPKLEETILVRDIVVVSIGDSYASGEGNPEIPGDPARWADAGGSIDLAEDLDHDAAHRSGLAGPAQAALALERSDPHTSVTFVFLAASGSGIESGILGEPDPATGRDGDKRTLRPQVEHLAELMGCDARTPGECSREIDHLLISAGGNDIGFAFAVGSLIAIDPLLAVNPIYSNLLDNLIAGVGDDIDELPGLFDRVAEALESIDVGEVILTAYPGSQSVVVDGSVQICDEIGGDLLPGLEVDAHELEAVRDGMLIPLNDTLRSVAATHAWRYVDSHVAAFAGHGYCGSDPYAGGPYAGNPFPDELEPVADPAVRWFRTATESPSIQGGGGLFQPERLATSGTFHPNEFGHQAYAAALLEAIDSG